MLLVAALAAVVAFGALIGLGARGVAQAANTATLVADPNTSAAWTQWTNPDGEVSTQNVGRVWTDKTVVSDEGGYKFGTDTPLANETIGKGDSDFIVGLSALSSASNVRSVTTTSTPLDIVLVLDRSGSMTQTPYLSVDSYNETYNVRGSSAQRNNRPVIGGEYWTQVNAGGPYYVLIDGEYKEVTEVTTTETHTNFWGQNEDFRVHQSWTLDDGTVVEPMTGPSDTDGKYQFYERQTERITKMEALRRSVNNFIDSAEATNGDIRIALVSFAGSSSIDMDFTNDWDALKGEVNSLRANGGTYSDEGFEDAQLVMNGGRSGGQTYAGARDGAKRVVIFFTDGEPGSGGSVETDTAAPTVNTAHAMKNATSPEAPSMIYSVAVVDGADPDDTAGNMNKFMHAVSSNYPDATAWTYGRGDFADHCDLGTRAQEGDYYKVASNANELDQVFQDIFKESATNAGSGSPIVDDSPEGNTDPNPLTFTDTLGAYMEVTGTGAGTNKMQVVYGDKIYASDSRDSRNIEGGVEYTYNFTGTVGGNDVYGEADLSKLSVTVKHYSDPSKGDEVTATIPADLLPLRYYSIDENNNMSVTSAYPIRLFYGVSLRQEAEDALANPTAESSQEVFEKIGETQVSADKKTIDFYTNSWKDATVGETTASFMPNESNKFYYFTANTPLYTDEDCNNPATWQDVQDSNTLYYKDTYYVDNNGEAVQRTKGVAVNRDGVDWRAISYDGNSAYIPATTQRMDRPGTLVSNKSPNETGTASTVLTPEWIDATTPDGHDTVSQHLGNNGKLSVPNPGSLEITKTVDWGNASDATRQGQGKFSFTVSLKDAEGNDLAGSYPYTVYSGDTQAKTGTVSNGNTLQIDASSEQSPETRIVINTLPAGAQFTVTETGDNLQGFTTVDASSQEGNDDTGDRVVSGSVLPGAPATVGFTNTYKADVPVSLSTWGTISAQKDFNGRAWRDTDSFEFNLAAAAGTSAPMPAEGGATKVVSNENPVSFGDIQFTKDGTYTYYISENNDVESPIAGVDYSDASYRVDVVVTDGGNGSLKIDSVTMTRVLTDDNQSVSETISPSGSAGEQTVTALFTNTYSAETGNTTINGKKSYTDGSNGGNPISNGKFSFQIEALGGYETGSIDTDYAETGDYTVGPADVPMPRGTAEGSTTYVVGNVNDGFAFGPIDYDQADVDKTFEYRITERNTNLDGQTEANMSYDTTTSYVVKVVVTDEKDAEGEGAHVVATVSAEPGDLAFTNTFTPDEVTLGKDDAATIGGTKAIDGRAMTDDDTFTFSLKPYDDDTKSAIADGTIKGIGADGLTTEVAGPADEDAQKPFSFDGITFTKFGTYKFLIDETNEGKSEGLTYDAKTCVAAVSVTVDHATGDLVASVTYDTNGNNFVNIYNASGDYSANGQGGLNVSKTMSGDRTMAANEFTFTVAGKGPDGNINETLGNGAAANNGTSVMKFLQSLSFDQDDKDTPFTFTVKENLPAAADRLPGVTYDQSEYQVIITPRDNGDGTMRTETVVMRTKDATGAELTTPEQVGETITSTGSTPAAVSFTNVYEPAEVTIGENADAAIKVIKTVTGAPSPEDVTYSFTLTPTGDNVGNIKGLDNDGSLHVSTTGQLNADDKDGTGDDSQTLTFGDLTFTKAGIYTFTVSEDDPASDDGWTFDTSDHTVTVEVVNYDPATNKYDGSLHILGSIKPVEIENSYRANPVVVGGDGASEQISVKKTVTGRATTDDQDFHFTIAPANESEWSEGAVTALDGFDRQVAVTDTMQPDGSKTVSFGALRFNAEGTYKFTITEDEGVDEAADPAGWTYDDHTVAVTVEVTDEGNDGQLDAKVTYDNSGAKTEADEGETEYAAFTNSYTADPDTLTGDSTTFNGTKVLDGRQWLEDETFGFTMKPVQQDGVDWSSVSYKVSDEAEAATVNANSSWTAEATANGNDSVAFWFAGDFTFSKAGTYTFNVTETSHNGSALSDDDTNGMTYDRHVGVITVTVTDDGTGNLHAVAQPGVEPEGADQNNMMFTNRYEATPVTYGDDVSEILGGEKSINDTTGGTYQLQANTFDFIMRRMNDANPLPDGLDVVEDPDGDYVTVKNAVDNGSGYDFGEITFTHDNMDGATDNGDGTRSKEFSYNIFESDTVGLAGISYSNAAYRVTFTVTEDLKSGEMTVVASARTLGENSTAVDMDALDFVNKYDPATIAGHQNIFKTIQGRNWLAGDAFTFDVSMTATELDGSEWTGGADQLPKVGKSAEYTYDLSTVTANETGNGFSYSVTIKPTNTAENTYRFDTGTISYEREGIYTYTVSEAKSSVAGVTEDSRDYTVTVTVTDDAGELARKVEIAPTPTQAPDGTGTGTLGFTNTYVPEDVTTGDDAATGITVQKTLSGRAWEDGDAFTFEIARGVNNTDGPLSADTTIEVSGTAGTTTAATKTFGSMTFTKDMLGDAMEKDFAYTITETSTSEDGVTVDSATVRNVTVTVTDDGTGDLKITKISYDNATSASTDDDKQVTNAAAFTNTYDAKETDGSVSYDAALTKVLTGHEWTDDFATFDFQITKVSGTLVDGTELAPEQIPDFAQSTASVSSKTDTNQDGNDYATFDFGKVTFTQAGTYVYEVSEVKPAADDENYNPGIDYSGNTATITITVTDKTDGVSTGQLVASAMVENNTFTNNYATGTVDVDAAGGLQIVKYMTGRDIKAGDFTFMVTGDDAEARAKLPEGKEIEVPVAASTSFSDNKASSTTTVTTGLSFSLADAGKSFTYTISEANGGQEIDGVTYDDATHTVTYEVVDGGNGTLTVNAYVDGSTEPAATYTATRTRAAADPVTVTFNNSYDAGSITVGGDDAAVTINATKALANRPLEDGMFTFDVTNAADKSDQPTVLLSGTNVGDKVSFDSAITYTTESLNFDVQNGLATRNVDEQTGQATYTYTYNVSERAVQGVTQNKGSFTITVNVVDDTKGNLTASVVYPDGTTTGSLGFENTYGQTGSQTISISGTKVLSADQGLNPPDINGKYTFTITGVDENDKALPAELMPASASTTNQNGAINFGDITYTMANVFGDTGDQLTSEGVDTMSLEPRERTFTYTIEETSGSVAGVVNDTTVKTVTVTVKDNGDGTITAKKSTEGQPTDFTFTNTYNVTPESSSLTGNGGFTITKELTSNTGRTPAEGEFAFQLIDKTSGTIYEAKNAADGSVSMPAVSFSAPGSYGFQLVEVGGDASGMTYDKNIYDVTATVTDDRDGSLSVAWSIPGLTGKDVTFTNDYEADPTSISVVAGKAISGRPLVDGEFTFQILENGKVVAEATNDANGQIAFPTLSYDKTGEHDYQIVEVKGNAGGVTYDDTVYTMHVSVTDNPQAGALSAKVTYPDGDPIFSNSYVASGDTSITFGATKKLEGRDLKAGEFSFELVGPDGKVVATATNAADGSVVFDDPVSFSAAGTYTYQVREVLPEDDDTNTKGIQKDGVTYDETVWTATVTVTDDYKGGLSASVSYGDGGNLPSFVNVYVEPPAIPQTGDTTNMVLPLVLAVGGVALVAGSLTVARRRSK